MTIITIRESNGVIAYRATGHAGDPLVCSAVSMLSGAIAGWAVNYGEDVRHSETSGDVWVVCKATPEARIAFEVARCGSLMLQENYGKFVKAKMISGV